MEGGLQNTGSTCAINSLIQIICRTSNIKPMIHNVALHPDRIMEWYYDTNKLKKLGNVYNMNNVNSKNNHLTIKQIVTELELHQ